MMKTDHAMKKEAGFSLIEVLIALLVLSIGLLGASSMQLSALNANQGSYSRFQAINVANELSERMHANIIAADSELYVMTFDALSAFDCDEKTYEESAISYCADLQGAAAEECSPQTMATFDLYETYCSSGDVLLNRQISISCKDSNAGDGIACSPASIHTIQVAWTMGDWNKVEGSGSCPKEEASCTGAECTKMACINLEVLP